MSADALFLLRSLTREHIPGAPIGDQLLPCCGHTMYPSITGEENVEIFNCNCGIDWEVQHEENLIVLQTKRGIV